MTDVAIGVQPLWVASPKCAVERQSRLGDENTIAMISAKLDDVHTKGYVTRGPCIATMNYFAVPKGTDDIRMVYDGTKSGLNDCLYAPWFILPDAEVLTRTIHNAYWCIDNNYGEMFLNFWLHPDLMQYSGMDLTPLYGRSEAGGLSVEVWTRCPMGQSPSPYATIQQTRRLKRLIFGDKNDPNNVFYWDTIHLNLPGQLGYRPGEPWITKRRIDGQIASDAHDYVDDLPRTAPTQEEAWTVGAIIAKTAAFYGVQDAARKRRAQMQRPGAWAGVICGTMPERPYITVTLTKWEKTKAEIQRLRDMVDATRVPGSDKKLDHKTLEQVAGYLNHVARAFPNFRVYLNGVYGSMNAWVGGLAR